jgi:hypothetical protein
MQPDPRQSAPATLRNRAPILAVLRRVLPATGLVLEIASGTGEHVAHFAAALPGLTFQPTEFDPARRASVDAWAAGLGNVRPAIALDASQAIWPVAAAAAMFCANMIHIAPWEATIGLIAGAGRVLPPGGALVLYGPFTQGRVHSAESNAAFDADLRGRDPRWGVRDLDDVAVLAQAAGLDLEEIVEMPANNRIVIFRRE